MNRIEKAFENGNALITFFTCGDPDMQTTYSAVLCAVAGGADIIGLNVPFSDPTAGSAESFKANERAFKSGTTTDKIFELIGRIRRDIAVPIVVMAYCNSIFSYGSEKFISACRQKGADAIIATDLPYEEKDEFLPVCEKYGVTLISLIACAKTERMEKIAREAQGFLYFVPSADGAKDPAILRGECEKVMRAVRKSTDVPCVLFGADRYCRKLADGLFDGIIADFEISAIVEKYGADSPERVGEFVKAVKGEIK